MALKSKFAGCRAMKQPHQPKFYLAIILGSIAVLFGALTIYSGGSVVLVDGQARAAAGNYVPFVVWFNFVAGFVYIAAGVGVLLSRWWAFELSALIFAATLLVCVAFVVHIMVGGAYEMRTVWAMSLRLFMWLGIGLFALATLREARRG